MNNNVKITSELNELQKLVVTAFLFGSDNYGETVVGVSDEVHWNNSQECYTVTVFLLEDGGHKSTSGIGIYPKCMGGEPEEDMLTFYSSGVVFAIKATKKLKKLLNPVCHSQPLTFLEKVILINQIPYEVELKGDIANDFNDNYPEDDYLDDYMYE